MRATVNDAEIKTMVEKALAYLLTPEGRAELIARQKICDEACKLLHQAAKVSWQELHEPFDI